MSSEIPPKRGATFDYCVFLTSQANGKLFQTSVTLAAGDVKWSKAGAAFNNVTNLPSEVSTTGAVVGALTTSETDCDWGILKFSDVSGAQWVDTGLVIYFGANLLDEVAARLPAALVSGRMDSSTGAMANNVLTNAAINDGALTAAKFASGAFDAVWSVAARTLTAFGFSVTVGTNNDKTGYALSSAGVQAIWDALTSALTTAGSIGKLIKDNLDAAITSRMATFTYTTPPTAVAIRTEMDSNSTKLADIVADTNEVQLELADGGRLDLLIDTIIANVAAVLADTGTDGVVISQATRQAIADEMLTRSASNTEGSAGIYTLTGLILAAFESAISGGTWTVKRTDGTTTFATRAVTTDSDADPIVGVS